MPIKNYVRPQTEIYQQLEVTLDEVGSQMMCCVIGPQYDLYRYGKEELPSTTFSVAETKIPYVFSQLYENTYKVDENYVKVFAEGLLANLAEFENKVTVDKKNDCIIRLTGGQFFAAVSGDKLATELKHYGAQIGDIVKLEGVGSPRTCTVTDIVGKVIPARVTAEKVQVTDETPEIELTSSAEDYTASESTSYILTVVKDGKIEVTDSAGIDFFSLITPEEDTEFAVGTYGVKAKITGVSSLKEGDVFSVACVAETASTTEFDGLLLDRMAVAIGDEQDVPFTKVTLYKEYDGEVCQASGMGNPYTVSEDGVTINPELALFITEQNNYAYFEDGQGKLFIEFRVMVIPPENEEKVHVNNISDIQQYFGTVDQDNDIAYGAYSALQGAASRAVWAIRTRGDSLEAFMDAARSTETDRDMYAYVLITENEEIARTVAEYNVTLCAPDMKMWRRTFWGVEALGEYTIATTDQEGSPLRAKFASMRGSSNDVNNNLVQIIEENKFDLYNINFQGLFTTLRPGDFVQLMVNGQKYRVKRIISTKELELEEGPKTEISIGKDIILIHANTPLNRREYVQQVCTRFNSLRKTVVWSDNATKAEEVIANKYLAAYIAGLASAVVPQASLTKSEVTLVDNASRTYLQYTRDDLDEIARYGCLVVAQDMKGAPCYVRHNLTTETDKGLLYYEESCIRNIDNMSFKTDDVLQKYIGHANVTASALRAIYTDLNSLYLGFTQNSASELLGPQLINFDGLSVRQDPTLKSRVLVSVNWYVPVPLNNIRVYEMAFVADVDLADAAVIATEVTNRGTASIEQ